MNLYKVSRKDGIDYDQYDSFVCVAETEEQAKLMFPNPDAMTWSDSLFHLQVMNRNKGTLGVFDENNYQVVDADWILHSWTDNINNLEVELVGLADAKYTMPQVIVASFNAG